MPLDVFMNSEESAEQKEKEISLVLVLSAMTPEDSWGLSVVPARLPHCQNNQLLSTGVIIAEPSLHASPSSR